MAPDRGGHGPALLPQSLTHFLSFMNALRTPIFANRLAILLGWPLLLGALCLTAMLAWPAVTDALLWRFEGMERGARLSQRAHERLALAEHRAQDGQLAAGTLIVLGDSHLSSIPAASLGQAHNFAIGGLSAARLADHLSSYGSLARAAGVVLGAGTNDLVEGASVPSTLRAWDRLLAALPPALPVLCAGIPEPLGEAPWSTNIQRLNQEVHARCTAKGHRFMAVTPGRGVWADAPWAPDGIHLAAQGSALLARQIRAHFPSVGTP